MKFIILTLTIIFITISIIHGKKLRSTPLKNYCPEKFLYNEKTKTCDIEIPDEYNIVFDDITGPCINGKCPDDHKCIDKDIVPFCIKKYTVQEAIDKEFYNEL
uniref:Secreted protein n=1 Tax=Parastrongyloides trichosuri TaxID=131310 RepID=A0A0N4ZPS2_PARTI